MISGAAKKRRQKIFEQAAPFMGGKSQCLQRRRSALPETTTEAAAAAQFRGFSAGQAISVRAIREPVARQAPVSHQTLRLILRP